MTDRLTQRSFWSTFSIALIGFLMLTLVAACGSDGDDDDSDSGTTTTATTSTGSSSTTETATEADTDDASATSGGMGDMGDAMAVGTCLQEGTTGDVVTDLRNGDTESAEGVYRDCLEGALPAVMVDQLDPIIEQAGECGSDAAADLSDEDVAAIEEGDEAAIQEITTATLECISADLGIDLQ